MAWPSAGAGPPRDFVGYGRRPPVFRWPDGSGVAVSIVVNYEEGAELNLLDGDGVNDTWGEFSSTVEPAWRDLGTETHFEFGSRVGVWRLARMFDEYEIPVSVGACAVALERNPELCAWLRERNHEVLGHGYRWTDDWKLERHQERAQMELAIDSVQRTTGQRVRGWYVRSFPSVNTRELLVEEGGFLYDSDSCNDELPYFADVKGTPFLVVPYTKVFNDNRYLIAPTYSTPNESRRGVGAGGRRPDDDGRGPHPLDGAAEPGSGAPALHRVRPGQGRRLLHAPGRHRAVLDRNIPLGAAAPRFCNAIAKSR